MATFIMAMSINPNAKKTHSDLATQIDQSLEMFNKAGLKSIKMFATLGRYDLLALFEAPDQATAFKVASAINADGILDTETWPVIPYEDFTRLIK